MTEHYSRRIDKSETDKNSVENRQEGDVRQRGKDVGDSEEGYVGQRRRIYKIQGEGM